MDLAIVSDSHIPERADAIPDPFRERIAAADHTLHVGDVQTADALAAFRDLADGWTGVRGNIDPADVGLPTVATVEAAGVTVVAVHGAVNPATRDATIGPDPDPDDWMAASGVVEDGRDWLAAVTTTARVVAAEGITPELERACIPVPAEVDAADVDAVAAAADRAGDPEGTVVAVGGHSHRVVEDSHRGVTVLNPGTVTGADPGPRTTMLTVELTDGDVDVTLHELDE
ncbi:metallophosphoesterase family protein [Halobaculum lipolyticum]|uniref:Metallophosphoesterase family protein n=1 Tax=Halobaculum lipolyticum TaxID=3032001 RepID=A0ABD5WAV2_9EURY|nr:metallophosphoesterase family protein [Halobaculum sp. DT31]